MEQQDVPQRAAFGSMPGQAFAMLMRGLHADAWTGAVVVDTGHGVKKVYFREGAVVFAASTAIDDRLGEVIYRDGMISLNDFTQSTARVSRTTKFGQVLLGSGIFDALGLWKALCLQVRQIVYSLYMLEQVYAEAFPGELPTSELAFAEGTADFLDEAFAFGLMFRQFQGRLRPESRVIWREEAAHQTLYPQGTFLGDFLELVRDNDRIERLLAASKVQEPYTLAALMLLINRGVCAINGVVAVEAPKGRSHLLGLRQRVEAYEALLAECRGLFAEAGLAFPLRELGMLALSLNAGSLPAFFLNDHGGIDQESLGHIYGQCLAVKSRVGVFVGFVDCLMGFLIQVADDQVGPTAADHLRGLRSAVLPR